jgi:hypothetical protein
LAERGFVVCSSFSSEKKNKDKRRHLRREKAFAADWTSSPEVTPTAVIGIDVSASGVGILSRFEIVPDEFILRLKLDNRVIPSRVKKQRSLPGTLQGAKAFRYGCEFVSISADDWDAVVRWSKGGAADDGGNKAQSDLEMVRMSADDADRLMPLALQQRLLAGLSRRGRLAPIQPNVQPLVQYFYGGTVKRNGMMMHRLAILSRLADADGSGPQEFRTMFYFDESGGHVEMGD